VVREHHIKDAHVLIAALDNGADLLQVFLELGYVPLDREIEIANGKSAYDVAHGAARKINVHLVGACDLLHLSNYLELRR
jgi:hypothetical protein